jgi:hypothetical protein
MADIEHIGALTPNALLAGALSEVEEIDHILLYVAKSGGGPTYVSWSRCDQGDIAYAMQMIHREFHRNLDDD